MPYSSSRRWHGSGSRSLARYPEVELVIGMGDRMVDLVREAVDCVIRVGELQDSTLVARRIVALKLITCATPGYLARYGVPAGIDDLPTAIL